MTKSVDIKQPGRVGFTKKFNMCCKKKDGATCTSPDQSLLRPDKYPEESCCNCAEQYATWHDGDPKHPTFGGWCS
jgi:hypothetical protein